MSASPTRFCTRLMTQSHVFLALQSVSLTSSAHALAGDEEFLFGGERGGRVCLLHVVSAWRVDLLRGRGLCALLLQHHNWQTGENPHGTVRPHSTCCIDVRYTTLKVCSLVRQSLIEPQFWRLHFLS